ncbi:NAD(P)H-hydrate dehydratase [Leptothrix discophora]|uniref:Bifunctional NAD(P)H-hydrate repair enzyme n=1 Tax=Leptothrix discophora TaxID=89 RepID=A0ABT9G147_LEPDI|nr:NAD(P)H-hydrate dehydratase [Leptothrix discophora]MDP4300150.1 NAD(P)H-hydrate dehydratase [Leptothrix discophora]
MPQPAFTPDAAPRRLLPPTDDTTSIDLHDAAHAAALERALAATLPPHRLMQTAGLAVARLARALAPHAHRVIVLAGPGNNGGDGFEAAARLRASHPSLDLALFWLGRGAAQPADAHAARLRAEAAGVAIAPIDTASTATTLDALCATLAEADADTIVIDALLGRGLNRPADGDLARLIEALAAGAARVLAVDLPSGLNGDTGTWPERREGRRAPIVRADATLALLSPSPGLFTGDGRDAVGELWWHDLDTASLAQVANVPAQARLERGEALSTLLQPRPHRQHKGSVGDLWVVGGDAAMQGAAWLAARAALHLGAGRVHVDRLDAAGLCLDPGQPELMVGRRADPAELARSTVVAGCGGGPAIAARLGELLSASARLVLDADALNAVSTDAVLQAGLLARAHQGLPSVLTPHPLEAARLLGCTIAEVQRDRLAATRALASRYRCTALLKGSGTIVCGPQDDAVPSINGSGNAALATPGSGDVLAGALGALWSRAAAASCDADRIDANRCATLATRAAVDLHGRVAQSMSLSGEALPASWLASGLGDALRRRGPGHLG